ncbi:MAG: glycoside hydrolase family 31 protein [Marinoscillum sp.]
MIYRTLYLLAVNILFLTTVSGQQAVGNYISGFSAKGNTVEFSFENADVRVEFCNENIVRLRTSWERKFEDPEPYMVVKYDWPAVDFTSEETPDAFRVSTNEVSVEVSKSPFGITTYNSQGDVLSHGLGNQKNGSEISSKKELLPGEHFFGFGERMDFLDRRGKQVDLYVGRGEGRPHIIGAYNVLEANYSPVPFFLSTRGYGIFLHNAYATHWDMGATSNSTYSFSADGGELDYYFIAGPDFGKILGSYTEITGKSPMMNRFAFGLHVGTYSGGTWGHEDMTSTQYVVALARKFRELGIPLDILHLDSTWRIFGENGGKGATTFEWRETFKNPEAMFDSLYSLNLNMVGVHLRPRFDNGNKLRLLDAAREKGYVYEEQGNPGEFVNFFDQDAVNWWWENGVMRVAEQGAMFLKTDEGSAFGRKANESNKVGPQGEEVKRLHNIFPLAYAKAPYEKFQEYNNLRGMNHTREGYAGIQRYPFIFAGDWPSEWQYFEPVIKAGLNIGISGVGYWAHCMGGFEHDADPELYIRWTQFGLMSPVAHLFGMDHPGYKEPWNYGDEALRIFKTYDSLRYSLIPYLYTQGWNMYQTGMPIMQALVLKYQNDVNTYNITDQYLLGESILVCPVTTKEAKTRSLYLPEGKWYNHWNGETYKGGQYVHEVTPLDQMPIFYKAGSIIPTQYPVQYIDKEPLNKLALDIYPGSEASFELYEDDGRSLDYQSGGYTLTNISYTENNGERKINIKETKSGYELPDRTYTIRLRTDKAPSAIKSGSGKKAKAIETWEFDNQKGVLTFDVLKESGKALEINLL